MAVIIPIIIFYIFTLCNSLVQERKTNHFLILLVLVLQLVGFLLMALYIHANSSVLLHVRPQFFGFTLIFCLWLEPFIQTLGFFLLHAVKPFPCFKWTFSLLYPAPADFPRVNCVVGRNSLKIRKVDDDPYYSAYFRPPQTIAEGKGSGKRKEM